MIQPRAELVDRLLRWYDGVHADRAMPWRKSRDPYAIWISEIMLQQTQVETVKPYYSRFLNRFPTVQALAAADLQEVLAHWAGLGYYRRAKHLHAAAKDVVARFGGALPEHAEELRTLAGVGRYTAGAIASIAFGEPEPVVDGNVMRVLARLTGYDKDIAQPRHTDFFWEAAGALHVHLREAAPIRPAPPKSRGIESRGRMCKSKSPRHGDLNQALMELGATVCTPASPRCASCPLHTICRAHAARTQEHLPVKTKKRATPVQRFAAVVILRKSRAGQQALLVQRPNGGLWESMWEFPAIASGRAKSDARVIAEKIGTRLTKLRRAGRVKHQLTHRTLMYDVVVAHVDGKECGLPVCPDRGAPYVQSAWLPWPLAEQQKIPLAAVVRRIADIASDSME